ncbi:hypothetical protein Dsin_012738 [Dipteronia sinensis]|uniref:Uncharacterized protein n=1 Tax=Dipteronia sinensis TaxID=43782 RepID=A0AAE0E881_9ROSI|nr:hypothetical protein Dsin_012738 [Dipteronia sinensis]
MRGYTGEPETAASLRPGDGDGDGRQKLTVAGAMGDLARRSTALTTAWPPSRLVAAVNDYSSPLAAAAAADLVGFAARHLRSGLLLLPVAVDLLFFSSSSDGLLLLRLRHPLFVVVFAAGCSSSSSSPAAIRRPALLRLRHPLFVVVFAASCSSSSSSPAAVRRPALLRRRLLVVFFVAGCWLCCC